jgi:hypothetical protein
VGTVERAKTGFKTENHVQETERATSVRLDSDKNFDSERLYRKFFHQITKVETRLMIFRDALWVQGGDLFLKLLVTRKFKSLDAY